MASSRACAAKIIFAQYATRRQRLVIRPGRNVVLNGALQTQDRYGMWRQGHRFTGPIAHRTIPVAFFAPAVVYVRFRYTQVGADHKTDGHRLAGLLAKLLISIVPISDP